MDRIRLSLEHCYGIRKLDADLPFVDSRAIAIYAPNGAMKTSLADAFKDIADGRESVDRIFPARKTKREISDHADQAVPAGNVVVLKNYGEIFKLNEQTSTLLVDNDLRLRYEQVLKEARLAKERLVKQLKKSSGSKADFEREISFAFTRSYDNFDVAIRRVREEVEQLGEVPLKDVRYDTIFESKLAELLSTPDFQSALDSYVRSYNRLLDNSTYFKRGVFNYYNASTIARSLADNGFFSANHRVHLAGDEELEIKTVEQLEQVIQAEKEAISNDPDLRAKFKSIGDRLEKNQSLRDLHAYLSDHESLLPHLVNLDVFKQEVLKSYLRSNLELYLDLIAKQDATRSAKMELEAAAAGQTTQWEEVIALFNERFAVPFRLRAENRIQVRLGQEKVLRLGFTFEDGSESAEVAEPDLMRTLSTGEMKAFYLLHVMFEMEVRKKTATESLVIADDVADSFDYKNKYAIIEYLRDLSEEPSFRQIILTHNFDFFRTVSNRFVGRQNSYMAIKSTEGINLVAAEGMNSIFLYWKSQYAANPVIRVAVIPFVRNIVEYTFGKQDPRFSTLTSMLHVKPNTATLTAGNLDTIYNGVFNTTQQSPDPGKGILDLVFEVAQTCLQSADGPNIENKIALSIGIRLAAEQFMIDKINDPSFLATITKNQTSALYDRYRRTATDAASLQVLRQVILMTPESIHLNSFMFEPILDMSDDHLKRLYTRVRDLA